ncbi:hypothetical protein VU07_05370 [Desulfobulbus sp. F4]|nr:hypothetical protein [Desulfobulbus sp. F4]
MVHPELGKRLAVRAVLKQWPAEVLRLFLFSTQYRNPLDYNETALRDAEAGLDRMYDCLAKIAGLDETTSGTEQPRISGKDREKIISLRQQFAAAMDNNFNTAQALGHLFDAVKLLNKAARLLLDQPGNVDDLAVLRQGAADLRELAGLLGLLGHDPAQHLRQKKEKLLAVVSLSEEEINELIARRNAARERKDWAASDAVRDELLAHKIELQDSPDGTDWSVKVL